MNLWSVVEFDKKLLLVSWKNEQDSFKVIRPDNNFSEDFQINIHFFREADNKIILVGKDSGERDTSLSLFFSISYQCFVRRGEIHSLAISVCITHLFFLSYFITWLGERDHYKNSCSLLFFTFYSNLAVMKFSDFPGCSQAETQSARLILYCSGMM